MLKSIVNCAEHDIVSIPMKGKNLLNLNRTYSSSFTTDTTKWMNGAATLNLTGTVYAESEILDNVVKVTSKNPGYGASFLIEASPNTTYTVSFETDKTSSGSWGGISDRDINGTVIDTSAIQGKSTTFTTHDNCAFLNICFRFPPADGTVTFSNIMLNLGSTPLPYEPYGYQEGWEVRDNQDRLIWGREDELQTATGTLPFKGYGLPLKVKSLLGNAVQNGTPAPDNIIAPEMCGVRTGNIAPPLTEWVDGYIEGGTGTIHKPSAAQEKTSPFINIKDIQRNHYLYMQYEGGDFPNGGSGSVWTGIGYYDDNEDLISRPTSTGAGSVKQYTIPENAAYCRLSFRTYGETGSISLSDGTAPPPYEPYGWKVPFENHGENLLDKTEFTGVSATIEQVDNGIQVITENGGYAARIILDVQENTDYTLSYIWKKISGAASNFAKVFAGTGSSTEIASFLNNTGGTFNTGNNKKINIWFYAAFGAKATVEYTNIMLTHGSTPKPYSPYLNETIPVYLGEVPTVRRVKKLVLTRESDVDNLFAYNGCIYVQNSGMLAETIVPFCNCLIGTDLPIASAPMNSVKQGRVNNQPYPAALVFKLDGITTTTGFLNFLSTMNSAGTPVTIWYVLAEPETTISNEPLCKISTYADELTTIQVHGLSAPLYGIGDYKDTLNLSTGVVTRKVKKLVLTGEENWNKSSTYLGSFYSYQLLINCAKQGLMCTHAIYTPTINATDYTYGKCAEEGGVVNKTLDLYIGAASWTLEDFKSYLAAQYQAGTPVTVWYVLDTPTTETVTVPTGMTGEIEGYLTQVSTPTPTNRSVPKWNGVEETGGTYAVTVYTPPEIPTTTGQNTLTVGTTLAPSKLEVSVHAKKIHYGFKIDKSNDNSEDAVIYTHDAVTMTPAHMDFTNDRFDYGSWGNAFFVRDCYPVALNLDGTEAYRLDPDDYTKKMDGTASDIFYELLITEPSDWSTQWKQYYTKSGDEYALNSQSEVPTFTTDTYYKLTYTSSFTGNFMMAFPKVWFYRHEDSQYNYIEISNHRLSDDWKCYAHINANGQEVDFIYLPLFKGVIKDSKLRSLPGQIPQGNTTATIEANAATALGSRWQIWDHSSAELINDLLTLMSKSIDSQGRFGQGRSTGYNSADTVTYGKLQTGTLIKKGKFHGYSAATKEVKVFGIEGFWANRWDRLQGMLLVNNVWKIKMTPPYNFTGTDFITLSNAEVPSGSGYLSKVQTFEYGSIPASIANGSSTKYFKDYFYKTATDTRVAIRGGNCAGGGYAGFRYVSVNLAASRSAGALGASPVYK